MSDHSSCMTPFCRRLNIIALLRDNDERALRRTYVAHCRSRRYQNLWRTVSSASTTTSSLQPDTTVTCCSVVSWKFSLFHFLYLTFKFNILILIFHQHFSVSLHAKDSPIPQVLPNIHFSAPAELISRTLCDCFTDIILLFFLRLFAMFHMLDFGHVGFNFGIVC